VSSLRAVVFDLGGVLVQINHSWGAAARQCGLSVREDLALGKDPDLTAYQGAEIGEAEYLQRLAARQGLTGAEEAQQLHMAILSDPYPGSKELVDTLQALGLVTACLSNTSALHWPFLTSVDHYPAIAALHHHFASHELGLNKPDTAIYATVELALALEGPEIMFFDDGAANVAAAQKRGWQGVVIDPHDDPARQMRGALGLTD
jgi:HAD superfamily hydrolase (TIGR01509 family)